MKPNKIGTNSIIAPSVTLKENVEIGHNVILEGDITVGSNTRIDHGVIIRGTVTIGKNNWIYPYCVIGAGPEHLAFKEKDIQTSIDKNKTISIGDNNVIKEYVTINLPVIKKGKTAIGSNCYVMAYSHMGHDAILYDNVTFGNAVIVGGHCEVFDNTYVGMGNNIHPFCKIGAYSILGMGNEITKDVLPFSLMNKREFTKINKIGLLRNNIKESDIAKIESFYSNKKFSQKKTAKTWYEKEISNFIKKSTRGYYLPKFSLKVA